MPAKAVQEVEEPELTEVEVMEGISNKKTLELTKKLKMGTRQPCPFGCAQEHLVSTYPYLLGKKALGKRLEMVGHSEVCKNYLVFKNAPHPEWLCQALQQMWGPTPPTSVPEDC